MQGPLFACIGRGCFISVGDDGKDCPLWEAPRVLYFSFIHPNISRYQVFDYSSKSDHTHPYFDALPFQPFTSRPPTFWHICPRPLRTRRKKKKRDAPSSIASFSPGILAMYI